MSHHMTVVLSAAVLILGVGLYIRQLHFFPFSLYSETSNMGKEGLSPLDPSSYARPENIIVRKLHLVLDVDFNKSTLSGKTDLTVEKLKTDANELILDVKSLNISSIILKETGKELNFTISDTIPDFGSKLSIQLPSDCCTGQFVITIKYETSPDASGLQWMAPELTAGKVHPYMYSQFQPIHARSMIPCQDTPYVKTPYTAEITAPSALTVLMSALRGDARKDNNKTTYIFHQDVPMPSYLIAIVVGALESRKIGPRSHVWAEKEVIAKAEYEFADTEAQLSTAEAICGPYVWGIYDLLVLPPSFPFGGMENPCLTFVTPTLLAGDRSLANVVAHEIAHSWTGNLVTNRNFEHFWLNEGFTMFMERKIVGRLTNKQNEDFDAIEGASELEDAVKLFGPENPLTSLVVNLKGVHPDDAFSRVPYEKGYIFLRYLQNVIGGPEPMESFLRKYFETFKYKSIDSETFQNYFTDHFSTNSNISTIDWNRWLHSPGMPPVIPEYDDTLTRVCDALKKKWETWESRNSQKFDVKDFTELTTQQKITFLSALVKDEKMTLETVKEMDSMYDMGRYRNAEIRFLWIRLCLKARWDEKIKDALTFVTEIGRMKFVRPLYRDLYDWPTARPDAIKTFEANRKTMMHVSAYTVAKDLHLKE